MEPKVSVKEMLDYGCVQLKRGGSDSPRLDAELILAWVIGRDRLFLYAHPDYNITKHQRGKYLQLIRQRLKGKPVGYIIGSREFMGLEFEVNPSVLIPRPDTEVLVEAAVEWINHLPDKRTSALDIGTGSGAIAVSLAKYCAGLRVKAVDVSDRALEVAASNAKRHGVRNRIEFIKGDMFRSLEGSSESFNLIVSNPPYISQLGMDRLQREVRFEPRNALYGGPDGLEFYREIAVRAVDYLKKGGLLAVEIGYDQAPAVLDIFRKARAYTDMDVIRDLAGEDRVVLATVSGPPARPAG